MELGSTIVRIVCQRLAPMFQQASRKDMGTADINKPSSFDFWYYALGTGFVFLTFM